LISSCSRDHRDIHSFPTRRSSDLAKLRRLDPDCAVSIPERAIDVFEKRRQVERERRQRHVRNPPAHANDRGSAAAVKTWRGATRSEEHTSELQSPYDLVCRLLLEK